MTCFANAPGADPTIETAIAWLACHPAGQVHDLARLMALSERQLHRRFCAEVGYAPKTLQRILRLQRLLWLSTQELTMWLSLANLAQSVGYADQAHMGREILTLTGETPQKLLTNAGSTLTMSDLFNTAECSPV